MQPAVLLVTVVHLRAPARLVLVASVAQQRRTQGSPQLPEVAAAMVVLAARHPMAPWVVPAAGQRLSPR